MATLDRSQPLEIANPYARPGLSPNASMAAEVASRPNGWKVPIRSGRRSPGTDQTTAARKRSRPSKIGADAARVCSSSPADARPRMIAARPGASGAS